jgi:octaprenyl-diphosphate synthase
MNAQVLPAIPKPKPAPTQVKEIQSLMAADLQAVDAAIRHWLSSDVELIPTIGEHLIAAGGKRLRPLLTLLCARAMGVRTQSHVTLAAIIEFIHTATLLHDDVVDESDLRRGRKTANALWGNASSVLVGDFLYSRSFQMMVALNEPSVMAILADTTNQIAEGEVLQLMHVGNAQLSEQIYLQVIERKTAVLFAAACSLGVVAAGADPATQQIFSQYGHALGMAFQIADDVLDYTGNTSTIGKNLGDDLAEGKVTLPLIIAQQRASAEEAALLRDAIKNRDRAALDVVTRIIRQTDAIAACEEIADRYAQKAHALLESLPSSIYLQSLRTLCDFATQRAT